MKYIFKFALMASTAVIIFMADVTSQSPLPPLGFQLISDAHAVAGRQRRTRRRGVAVGYAAGSASGAEAATAATAPTSVQQPATTEQQPATTTQPAATEQQPATSQ